jgi:hypothetical protein
MKAISSIGYPGQYCQQVNLQKESMVLCIKVSLGTTPYFSIVRQSLHRLYCFLITTAAHKGR